MENKWKVDYDKRIIYVSRDIINADLLKLINELSSNDRGLKKGPEARWRILVIEQ